MAVIVAIDISYICDISYMCTFTPELTNDVNFVNLLLDGAGHLLLCSSAISATMPL